MNNKNAEVGRNENSINRANLEKRNEDKMNLLNEKLELETRMQEAELLLDFDEILEEAKKEKPLAVKFNNQLFEVPKKMPFNFSMFFFRYCLKKRNGKQYVEVPEEKMLQFVELMIGKKFTGYLERNRNSNISIEMIFDKIANPVMKQWGYDIGSQGSKLSQEKKI